MIDKMTRQWVEWGLQWGLRFRINVTVGHSELNVSSLYAKY